MTNPAKVSGAIGDLLEIEINEESFAADVDGPDGIEAWKRGDAFHLIPPEEESNRARYEKDPVKKGEPAGQFRSGIHFAEICTMQRLRDDGFTNWLYEVYSLFEPASGKLTVARTKIAREALGDEVADRLLEAGEIYKMDVLPKIPDLMAWRDVDGIREFRFIEAKSYRRGKTNRAYFESVKVEQLLGLAILATVVPNSSVHIYRWINKDMFADSEPQTHTAGFLPPRK